MYENPRMRKMKNNWEKIDKIILKGGTTKLALRYNNNIDILHAHI